MYFAKNKFTGFSLVVVLAFYSAKFKMGVSLIRQIGCEAPFIQDNLFYDPTSCFTILSNVSNDLPLLSLTERHSDSENGTVLLLNNVNLFFSCPTNSHRVTLGVEG